MKRPSFLWMAPTLNLIGRKFGIDAHYFAKNSALVLLGHAVSVLRGIVTGYLVARFFQKEIYGEYQFILSVLGMLSLLSLPGLAHSVTRAWARGDAFSLAGVTKHLLKVTSIGSLFLLGCVPFLGYYGREDLWLLFLVAAVLFPLSPIATIHFGGFTVGKARFDLSLKATIIWSFLMILSTLGIIFFHQSALLMLLTSMSVPALVYLWYSREMRPPAEEGSRNTRAILRYGWQLTFSTLPINLVWYVDKLLISHYFGLNQLATFSIALLIPEHVKTLAKEFMPVVFAKQAAGDDSRQRRIKLFKAVLIGTAVFAVGIGLYIVVSPFLIPLLFPRYDAGDVILLTNVAAVTLITTPGGLFAQYLEARRMIREIRFSTWSAAIAFGVAMFLLIPSYGLLGAVLARGVFRFVYLCTTGWFVLRAPIVGANTLSAKEGF